MAEDQLPQQVDDWPPLPGLEMLTTAVLITEASRKQSGVEYPAIITRRD
jgi:hypothetical protein